MTTAQREGYKQHHLISPLIGNKSIRPEKTRILKGFLASSAAWLAG
jgi:hypothetical protein